MPHYKCDACRIRITGAPTPIGPPTCPDCSAELEPVRNLEELVGLQVADGLADERWSDDDGPIVVSVALPVPDWTLVP